jgi:septation ring formation regulator EzrA
MDFQNLKLPLGIVLLILAQAFGVIWYVSGLDANVKTLNSVVAEIKSSMDAKEIAILSTELSHLKEKVEDVENFDFSDIHLDDLDIPSFDALFGELDHIYQRLDEIERNGGGDIPQDVYWQMDDLWREIENSRHQLDEVRFQMDTFYYQVEDINIRLHDLERRIDELLEHRWN